MSQIKILIADDHQLLLDGIVPLLQKEPQFTIVGTAVNGQEVINWIEKTAIDICLLDINMPRLDGMATAKLIRESKPAIKIIILTTYNDKEIITEMLQTGVSGYMLKNSSQKELVEAIKKVMAGGLYFSNEVYDTIMQSYVTQLANEKSNSKNEHIFLTEREKEIVLLLAKEYTNEKIAADLNISYRTVETHRKNIMQKTKSHNLAGLLKFAYSKGLIQ